MEELEKIKKDKISTIPVLKSYNESPAESFWDKFPKKGLPSSPVTKINFKKLEEIIYERKGKLTECQLLRALKVVKHLQSGAPSHQLLNLPPVFCANAKSAYEYGEILTDTIADWIREGFVSGPFIQPPVKKFRVNPLGMVPQHDKVRPIVNVSKPEGKSFNDNINGNTVEKVYMTSPQSFSYSLVKSGKNSIMTKFDMRNAYKNMPCRLEDIRLQGFSWLGRYFVETTQMFGARTSVSNFDMLGNTIQTLALASCSIPSILVHRQLDDVPVAGPPHTTWCEEFTEEYASLCDKINIQLAEECPKKNKAFKNSTNGKVLGIYFDSRNLSWVLPEEKRIDYCNLVHSILMEGNVSLDICQSVLGKLNFVCTMAPFMRTFKRNVQELLRTMEESSQVCIPLSEEARTDLQIWWNFLNDLNSPMPIAHMRNQPTLLHKVFTTDAAGWFSEMTGSEVGLGCIGLDESGKICFINQTLWDLDIMKNTYDSQNKYLGNKTTSLEFAGILIPFLLKPDLIMNQHVVIQVDNIGCVFAWENGYSREDNITSILVRVLTLLSAKLSCVVHVKHLSRCSDWGSNLADRLSRSKTTTSNDRKLLKEFSNKPLPVVFKDWMDRPFEDWDLPIKILSSFV